MTKDAKWWNISESDVVRHCVCLECRQTDSIICIIFFSLSFFVFCQVLRGYCRCSADFCALPRINEPEWRRCIPGNLAASKACENGCPTENSSTVLGVGLHALRQDVLLWTLKSLLGHNCKHKFRKSQTSTSNLFKPFIASKGPGRWLTVCDPEDWAFSMISGTSV